MNYTSRDPGEALDALDELASWTSLIHRFPFLKPVNQHTGEAMPKPLRLTTHRVKMGEQLVCAQTGTFPERGDVVFQLERDGIILTFRSVKHAESYFKTH